MIIIRKSSFFSPTGRSKLNMLGSFNFSLYVFIFFTINKKKRKNQSKRIAYHFSFGRMLTCQFQK